MTDTKKPTLMEFLKGAESRETSQMPALARRVTSALTSIGAIGLGEEQAAKFRERAAALATSEEVLKSVSDELGAPKPGETEDEFVRRGKAALKAQLLRALNKS